MKNYFRSCFGAGLLLIFILFSPLLYAYSVDETEQAYQQALKLARAGKVEQALPVLNRLMDQYPQTLRYRYDYIQVLSWAEKNAEVIRQSHHINLVSAPNYVLESVALAYRHQRHFSKSKNLYQQLLARNPKNINFRLGLAGVLIDQKKTSSARLIFKLLLQQYPNNIDVLIMQAYAKEVEANYLAATIVYERILRLKLNYKPAIRGLVFALSANKAFALAYQKAEQNRTFFSTQEWVKLNWDLAANFVRWGEIPSKSEKTRFDETDHAIEIIEKNMKMLEKMQLSNHHLWQSRAQFDLIVALRDRKRMQAVLNLYHTLKHEGVELPAYVKIAVADAFLYMEKPKQARDLYLEVLKEIPSSYNASQSLVYAYVESEQLDLANELAKQLAKQQRDKLWFKSPKGQGVLYSKGNSRKTETELAIAVIAAFSERLDEAYRKVEFLYRNASFNTEIRNVRANIYSYRGWPRQAKRQFISALNMEPKSLGLRTGLSSIFHELREYKQEELNTETLYQQYPEEKGVQKQKRLWDIHNQREFKMFANGGGSNSEGSAGAVPVTGSEFVNLDSFLYSQPLNYHYRLFSHFNWQTGVYSVGTDQNNNAILERGYFQRYGLGLEYAIPDLIATGEIHYDNFAMKTLGFRGTLDYQFDDFWSFGFKFDSRSNEIGIRALNSGNAGINPVTAKSFQSTLIYRVHESRQFQLGYQFLDYSDGNKRLAVNGTYFERWISGPIYKLSTYINAGTSLNTRQDGNYYHPENDFNTSVTLENDFLTYRFYDLSFHQRLALTVGYYWQKENRAGQIFYHSDPTGSIQYEHQWKASDRYELVYGGIRSYSVYDGNRAESWQLYLNLNVRF